MKLSRLILASILFISPALLAQHSSGGGSSSGGSSSHSSSSSGSSSHASSSANSSHSSSSAGSHSASSHASAGSSGSTGSPISKSELHNSRGRAAESVSKVPPSRSGSESSGSDAERTIHEPVTGRVPIKENELSTAKTTQPEKRGFFSFFRHPFRKPEPKRKPVNHVIVKGPVPVKCGKAPCPVCPPGQSAGKNGKCAAPPPPTNIASTGCQPPESWNGVARVASTRCRPGAYWNGAMCTNTAECAAFSGRAAILANELRGMRAQMQSACSNNSSGQECVDLTNGYEGALQRYRMLLNEAPLTCRTSLPDPASL